MKNAKLVEQPEAAPAHSGSEVLSLGGIAIPVIENIHQKIYEAVNKPNALDMCAWHTCQTTHCRAGWVVHLAGDAGYALENQTSALFAAQQIYRASGYEISPVRFFDNNDAALADMKRLAEEAVPAAASQIE